MELEVRAAWSARWPGFSERESGTAEQHVSEELAEFEDFLWGSFDSRESGEMLAESVAAKGVGTSMPQGKGIPWRTLEEELPLLQQARVAQRELLTGILAAVPQAFSFLAACGPACLAHGHGILSSLGSAGGSFSGGMGIPGFGHRQDHAHDHEHDHHHEKEVAREIPHHSLPETSSFSPYQANSAVTVQEYLWLPVLWGSDLNSTVSLDELWAPAGNYTSVNELSSSFLRAA